MWTPNGNVYVVKTDGLYKVPTNVQRLKDIIPQLFSIWQMGVSVPDSSLMDKLAKLLTALSANGGRLFGGC